MDAIDCPACTRPLAAGATFCPYCGEVLPTASAAGAVASAADAANALPPPLASDPPHVGTVELDIDLESLAAPGPAAPASSASPPPVVAPPPPASTAAAGTWTDSQGRRMVFLRGRLEADPARTETYRALAQLHEEAGDPPGAAYYYAAALRVDPRDGDSAERLARLGVEPAAAAGAEASRPAPSADAPAADPVLTAPADARSAAAIPSAPVVPRPTGRLPAPRTTGATRPSPAGARGARDRSSARPRAPAGTAARLRRLPVGIAVVALAFAAVLGTLLVRHFFPGTYAVLPGYRWSQLGAWSADGSMLAFLEPPQSGAGLFDADRAAVQEGAKVHVQRAGRPKPLHLFEDAAVYGSDRLLAWGGSSVLAYPSARPGRIALRRLATADDPPDLLEGSSPTLSPDGTRIAYLRPAAHESRGGAFAGGLGYEEDEDDGGGSLQLFVYDVAARRETQLTRRGAQNPRWAPAGDLIAYEEDQWGSESHSRRVFSEDESTSQILTWNERKWLGTHVRVVDAAGGEPTTLAADGVNRVASWVGGDGQRLSWVHWPVAAEGGRYVDEESGVGFDARPEQASLWRAAADGSGAEELLSFADDAVSLGSVSWLPDGESLVYTGLIVSRERVVLNAERGMSPSDLRGKVDLFLYEVPVRRSARLRGLPDASRMAPLVSPDGRRLAYASFEDVSIARLFVVPWRDVDPRSR